jgi:hypothetical protein
VICIMNGSSGHREAGESPKRIDRIGMRPTTHRPFRPFRRNQ